jgi:hypothetical protein
LKSVQIQEIQATKKNGYMKKGMDIFKRHVHFSMKREKVFDGLSRAIQCSHTVILEMKNMGMSIEEWG